ncbi:flagellar hook-basal body complex protein FliE [Stappia sp.]|jgi:flagellar hook-basal body complex protein FliE|uniref:flagellar hook-basal body complex protein FliE n=1 Tax=Stappia sp. TaxID=1870903 RepID=UPI003A9A560C
MSIPSIAANAYRITSALSGANQDTQAKATSMGAPDFAGMVKSAVENVVDQGKKSDQQAMALAEGKANVVDVVTAVAETEVAMETLVSVRDRVISAYQEIMRMPI